MCSKPPTKSDELVQQVEAGPALQRLEQRRQRQPRQPRGRSRQQRGRRLQQADGARGEQVGQPIRRGQQLARVRARRRVDDQRLVAVRRAAARAASPSPCTRPSRRARWTAPGRGDWPGCAAPTAGRGREALDERVEGALGVERQRVEVRRRRRPRPRCGSVDSPSSPSASLSRRAGSTVITAVRRACCAAASASAAAVVVLPTPPQPTQMISRLRSSARRCAAPSCSRSVAHGQDDASQRAAERLQVGGARRSRRTAGAAAPG